MAQDKIKNEEYSMLGGMNTKASQYLTGAHEFLDLSNLNFGAPGALTSRQGSTYYLGATVSGQITGLYEFQRLNGSSYVIAAANSNVYQVTDSWTSFMSGMQAGNPWDFVTFVDRLFAANGANFFKYDGVTTRNYALPNPPSFSAVITSAGSSLPSGTYIISYGYLNDRGYYGPGASPIIVSAPGGTFISIEYQGFSAPSGFGISSLIFYRTLTNGQNLYRTFDLPAGGSFLRDNGENVLVNSPIPPYIYSTLVPRFMDIYNNQLMTAGYSSIPSTILFSDIGEPEGLLAENTIEVRTNDGDHITGQIPYSGNFLIFKERSFHRLSGNDPNNFVLTEISDQYGCLSNRAIVAWANVCWFLDRKGIIEWNGANIAITSNKIEGVFARMNVDAAKDQATAVHDRLNNQVKFSFPVDGATKNNITVVFDYIADAWTTEHGYEPAIMTMARGRLDKPWVMYGGYTGTLHAFGATYFGDNGLGMTCLLKTRFLADLGNSVEKLFRRLFLDVKPVGASSALNVNFYQDYGASIVLTRTMYQAPFQSRIDFGIEAKSMSIEVSHFSDTEPMQLNGYTVEYRQQRRV